MGSSRAGVATSFALPENKWLFDCGLSSIVGWIPRYIFITHTHADHIHDLTKILFTLPKPTKNTTIRIYLPSASYEFMKQHLKAYKEMIECSHGNEVDEEQYTPNYSLYPLRPNESFEIQNGSTTYKIRTIELVHRVPCLGYQITQIKQQLKPEYYGLPGKEIAQLKKDGVHITDAVEAPYLTYLGDTTPDAFRQNPNVLSSSRVVVTECSFFDEQDYDRSVSTQHTHWNDLRPYVEANPNVMFVLIHFSTKYSALRIREFFNAHIVRSGGIDNVHPMVIENEISREYFKMKDIPSAKASTVKDDDDDDDAVGGHGVVTSLLSLTLGGDASSSSSPPKCMCRLCQRQVTTQ
jgi:ribonuclease Z